MRRAQAAKAARDADQALREQRIEAALADYFEAVARAERIRAEARDKADALIAGAEQAAAEPEAAVRAAIRRLRELTGSHAEVAGLCGLTVGAVRELLAGDTPPAGGEAVGHGC